MTPVSAALKSLLAVAKADAAASVLPLIVSFTNSIAANPTAVNVVAQAAKFQVSILAVLPTLEQSELAAIAGIINTEATTLLAPPALPPAAAAAAAAAAK
jgi:hypothetical protein